VKRRSGGPGQDGMTLVELLFLLAMVTIAMTVISRFILTTRSSITRGEAAADLINRNLRIATNLRSGLQGAIEFITAYGPPDPTLTGMSALHTLVINSVAASSTSITAVPSPVTFTSWPTATLNWNEVDMNGPVDVSATVWGNEIMYVSILNPLTLTAEYAWSSSSDSWAYTATSSTSTVGEVVKLDRYQFVYDYLAWDTRTAIAGVGNGLRLVEWRSQPFVSWDSLTSFKDVSCCGTSAAATPCCPRLTAAVNLLPGAGYNTSFNPADVTFSSAVCSSCFYPTQPVASVTVPYAQPALIPMYSWAYMDDYTMAQSFSAKPGVNLGHIYVADGHSSGQTAAPSAYSIAFNTISFMAAPAGSFPLVTLQGPGGGLQVPRWSDCDMAGWGFPAGFEVAINGNVGSREVVLRTVLMASNGANTKALTFQAEEQVTEISVAPSPDF